MSLPRIEVLKFLDKIYDKPPSGVGFTLLSRSYYYLRRRSPGPPFPPDHRQVAGERWAIKV